MIDSQSTLIADQNALAGSDKLLASNQIQVFKALGGGSQDGPVPDLAATLLPRNTVRWRRRDYSPGRGVACPRVTRRSLIMIKGGRGEAG